MTYDSSDSDSGESGEPAGSSSKKKNTSASDGMTAGSWSQDAAGNWYFKNAANGKNLVSAWAHIENPYAGAGQPKDSWFHFDANGVMQDQAGLKIAMEDGTSLIRFLTAHLEE